MGIGTSIVLIAVGAILKWGVTAHVSGIALGTVGTILVVVGIIVVLVVPSFALLFSLAQRGTLRHPEA